MNLSAWSAPKVDEWLTAPAHRVNGAPSSGMLAKRRGPTVEAAFDGTPRLDDVRYDDDGYPVEAPRMQNSVQALGLARVLSGLHALLKQRFPGAFVASDLGVRPPSDDDHTPVVAPDILYSQTAGRGHRRSYKLSIEPVPDFMLEVLSTSTRNRDLGFKQAAYMNMGVGEYWMFDPSVKYIPEGLVGLEQHPAAEEAVLAGVGYRRIEPAAGTSHHRSRVLGLDFRAEPPAPSDQPDYEPGWRCLRI